LLVESRVSYVPEMSVYFSTLPGYENLKYFANSLGNSMNEILMAMKLLLIYIGESVNFTNIVCKTNVFGLLLTKSENKT
jgi:hypothetical protein